MASAVASGRREGRTLERFEGFLRSRGYIEDREDYRSMVSVLLKGFDVGDWESVNIALNALVEFVAEEAGRRAGLEKGLSIVGWAELSSDGKDARASFYLRARVAGKVRDISLITWRDGLVLARWGVVARSESELEATIEKLIEAVAAEARSVALWLKKTAKT